jgi:type I restriction enzyme S subunit
MKGIQMTPTPFGAFLSPNKRPYTLADDQDADLLGMRLYGGGPFHREHKLANQIRKKTHFVVGTGDVIYNKLFAWKGTFGLVPERFDGMYVSDKFPTYALDRDHVDENYLRWFFRFPGLWDQARDMSTGSAALSKFTLNPPKFLKLTVPLPKSVSEQRLIAEHLDRVEEQVLAMSAARVRSTAAATAVLQAFVNSTASRVGVLGTLNDVLIGKPRNGWSARCDNSEGGTPVLTLSAVTGFNYDPKAIKRTSEPTDPNAHYWLKEGDLLITRSNTPDLVGHASIYSGSPSPCIYPDLAMKIPLDPARADTRFVWHWLQGPMAREFITTHAKGTSPTMKKIGQGTVMAIPFPSALSLSDQCQLREQLDLILEDRQRLYGLLSDSGRLLDEIIPASIREVFA